MTTPRLGLAGLIWLALASPVTAHEGHANEKPWRACAEQQVAEACSYSNTHGDLYRGTCQAVAEQLICVRNQPIQRGATAAPAKASALPAQHLPDAQGSSG